MTAPNHPNDGRDLATFDRLPPPGPLVLVAAVQALAASGRDMIGAASMWQLLQENSIGADGYSTCVTLERMGLLLPSTDASELDRLWIVPLALQDATLSARISAKLWLQAVVDYIHTDPKQREKILKLA
jgi:hypothetical protein